MNNSVFMAEFFMQKNCLFSKKLKTNFTLIDLFFCLSYNVKKVV